MQTASFDNYAARYDSDFTHSSIGVLQRLQVHKKLLPLLDKNKTLLEINCGTGHDALSLAKFVRSILATDISASMINLCKDKIKHKTPELNFKVMPIQDLHTELGETNFIFSNFGGLNCLSPDELNSFASNCAAIARQDTDLFFCDPW